MQYPPPGYNHTPAYQTSGLPFATSSVASASPYTRIDFPFVTKTVTVKANSAAIDIGFSPSAFNTSNYFTLALSQSVTLDVRVKEMYLKGTGTFSLYAGLTGIPSASIPGLTSSFAFSAADPYFTGSNSFSNVLVYQGI